MDGRAGLRVEAETVGELLEVFRFRAIVEGDGGEGDGVDFFFHAEGDGPCEVAHVDWFCEFGADEADDFRGWLADETEDFLFFVLVHAAVGAGGVEHGADEDGGFFLELGGLRLRRGAEHVGATGLPAVLSAHGDLLGLGGALLRCGLLLRLAAAEDIAQDLGAGLAAAAGSTAEKSSEEFDCVHEDWWGFGNVKAARVKAVSTGL